MTQTQVPSPSYTQHSPRKTGHRIEEQHRVNSPKPIGKTQVFTEIFPIKTEALPALTAYRILLDETLSPAENMRQQRTLAVDLMNVLAEVWGGNWIWSRPVLVTDQPPSAAQILNLIDELQEKMPATFGSVLGIEEIYDWQASPELIIDYVTSFHLKLTQPTILDALEQTVFSIDKVRIDRDFQATGWVIQNEPALSLAVNSRLLWNEPVDEFANSQANITDMVGLRVIDRFNLREGIITKVAGTLAELRPQILKHAQHEDEIRLIEDTLDSAWVYRIETEHGDYEAVSTRLVLYIHPDDVHRFGVSQQQAERALHTRPALRTQMIKVVADVLKSAGVIGNAYSEQNAPDLFEAQPADLEVEFGNGKIRPYDAQTLSNLFEANGLYQLNETGRSVKVCILDALSDGVSDFIEALRRKLEKDFRFEMKIVRERKVRVTTRVNVESAIRLLQKENADLILIFMPIQREDEHDDEAASVQVARAQTIGRGQSCMVIHESLMHEPETMTQLIIGLLARAGHIPYLLAEPVEYADRIIGCSFLQEQKRDGQFLTGISRIYKSNGQFLQFIVHTEKSTKEDPLPDQLLEAIFPRELIQNQRVVIHFEGQLRKTQMRALGAWEAETNATFFPVELSQKNIPYLYALQSGKINSAPRGTTLFLSEESAILTTGDAKENEIPQPLYVSTEAPFTIQQALHSVLAMSILHYGSLYGNFLPVTLHHNLLIESGLSRGILPTPYASERPFWL